MKIPKNLSFSKNNTAKTLFKPFKRTFSNIEPCTFLVKLQKLKVDQKLKTFLSKIGKCFVEQKVQSDLSKIRKSNLKRKVQTFFLKIGSLTFQLYTFFKSSKIRKSTFGLLLLFCFQKIGKYVDELYTLKNRVVNSASRAFKRMFLSLKNRETTIFRLNQYFY